MHTVSSRPRRAALALAPIIALYWLVGGLYAVLTPAWQAPDEPAHYNYVSQVARAGCCPVIEMGDWDQAYLSALTTARFAPELLGDLGTVQYEDHQPPLYYLLLAPVYALTGGDLIALRLASLLIGTLIVVSGYGVTRTLYPDRLPVALAVAAFVAFQPQHLAILASVNNDALGWALVGVALWASVAYVKGARLSPAALGVLVGLALVTKATAYLMAGVAGVAVVLRWWREYRAAPPTADRAAFVRRVALYLTPALALGLLWWGRNIAVYGFPDFLGLAAHDAVVVGQPRTADLIAQVGMGGYLSEALSVTFSSFWGRFGWMALPLVGEGLVGLVYPLFGALLAVAGLGWLLDAARARGASGISAERPPGQLAAWLLLGLTATLAALAYAYYNTEFVQFQGRYMFPLLIPLGVALALGIDAWFRALAGRFVAARWATPAVFLALAPLNVWLVWAVIAPNLRP